MSTVKGKRAERPVRVVSILNVRQWSTLRQYAAICSLCGGQIISVNINPQLAQGEAEQHLATAHPPDDTP